MVTIKVRIMVIMGGRERVITKLEHMEGALGVRGRVLFLDLGCSYKGVNLK